MSKILKFITKDYAATEQIIGRECQTTDFHRPLRLFALRVTPAIAAGITKRVWELRDLISIS